MTHKPLIVILAGSKADQKHCENISNAAKEFNIDVVTRIGSAHKTAEHALAILKQYEADPRPKIYITVAGRSNALSGFTDGAVKAPVIACPPPSESFGGMDIFSSLRMPSGIAPAVILEPLNAVLFAAKVFALQDPTIHERVAKFQQQQQERILEDDKNI